MASWDQVQTIGPPSLVPPKVDFSPLGELGTAYYQGQQAQRTQAIQNAFKGGLPTDPATGQPDYRAAAQKLFQLGGYDQGMALLKQAGGQQLIDKAGQGDRDFQNAVRYGLGGAAQPNAPTQPVQPVRPAVSPVNDPNLPPEDQISPQQAAAANAPAQPSVQPQPAPAQSQAGYQLSPSQIAAAAVHIPPTANPIFKQNPGAYADLLDKRADVLANQVDAGKFYGLELKGREEDIKSLRDRAGKIREQLQPTMEQRNIQERLPAQKIQQEAAQKRGEATYGGIGQVAKLWDTGGGKTYNNLAKSLLNQPAMYTGFGAGPITDIRKVQAMVGGDPKAALYVEALKKLTAADVLNTINSTRAEAAEGAPNGNAGRIFSQQVEQAEKTALNTESTLAGNRFLAELKGRMGDYGVRLRNLAADYYTKHKTIDEGFDRIVSADLQKNPLFTADEMKNPSLIGAPTSPYSDVGQMQAWGQQMGLKPGDAVRTPGGKLVHLPAANARAM